VDGESVEDFEKDLKGNLYKIWNRMSSGTYFPPPVRAVEVAKVHGTGTRILGVPTVADRIAQTVVAGVLEERAGRLFHPDSYGYRPKRSRRGGERSHLDPAPDPAASTPSSPGHHQGTVSSDSGSVVNAAFIGIFSAAQQPGSAPRHLPAHRPGPPRL
jgi:hypothetical protein